MYLFSDDIITSSPNKTIATPSPAPISALINLNATKLKTRYHNCPPKAPVEQLDRYIPPPSVMRSKAVSSLSPLWRSPLARSSIRSPTIAFQQRRGLAEDKSDLGGVGGSEPPGPQRNKHNWYATNVKVSSRIEP